MSVSGQEEKGAKQYEAKVALQNNASDNEDNAMQVVGLGVCQVNLQVD